MNLADRRRVGAARLAALGLSRPLADRSPLGVVHALGAMQAQELSGGLWSLGVRSGGALSQVLAAIDRHEITRTWPMRGTLHWVAAEDAGWMCRLLAAPAMRAAQRVLAAEGLTDAVIGRAGEIWAEHLAGAGSMTRAEAALALSHHGIDAGGQRCYHLLVRHSQLGLLCQGPIRVSASGAMEPTFVLLDAWVPHARRPAREEALVLLAERYVRSHGPVTERDLAGWCDQPLRVVREAVSLTDGRVRVEPVAGAAYLVHVDAPEPSPRSPTLLLAGFDEWLLGYKDRAAQLTREQQRLVVPGGNGVFRGTVVAGSVVVGSWRRVTSRSGVTVEVTGFGPLSATVRREASRAAAAYGRFVGRPATVRWSDG
ncbi:MAG: winged helix DNA-binding domain-containing protein [Dermatophilaceae bacterium]